MLDFVEPQKIKLSYAASIGNKEFILENNEYFKEKLKKFNAVSVREESTFVLLNDMEIDCKCVLDPTFLLTRAEWKKLLSNKIRRRKYLLVYFIHNGERTFSIVRNIAKKNNLEIVYINNYGVPVKGMKNIYSITPFEFLEYIFNAELIVTGSFHGIALSLNFNKQFLYEEAANVHNVNDRIYNLVEIFKLNNSIYGTKINFEKKKFNFVNYDIVNKILENKRKDSKDFLVNWLNK